MATKSFEELNTGALTIKNNELPESNTHTLVGNQLVDMVAKEQEIDGKVNSQVAQLRSDLRKSEDDIKLIEDGLANIMFDGSINSGFNFIEVNITGGFSYKLLTDAQIEVGTSDVKEFNYEYLENFGIFNEGEHLLRPVSNAKYVKIYSGLGTANITIQSLYSQKALGDEIETIGEGLKGTIEKTNSLEFFLESEYIEKGIERGYIFIEYHVKSGYVYRVSTEGQFILGTSNETVHNEDYVERVGMLSEADVTFTATQSAKYIKIYNGLEPTSITIECLNSPKSLVDSILNIEESVLQEKESVDLIEREVNALSTTVSNFDDSLESLSSEINSLKGQGVFFGYYKNAQSLPSTDKSGYAYVGANAPYAIYNCKNGVWTDSEVTTSGAEDMIVNVKDFGAIGDGVANDQPSIERAIAYAMDNLPCTLYFPKGHYGITSGSLVLRFPLGSGGLKIKGDGNNMSKIVYLDNWTDNNLWYAIQIKPTETPSSIDEYIHDIEVEGIAVYDTNPYKHALNPEEPVGSTVPHEETHGIDFQYVLRGRVNGCTIDNVGDEAIDIISCRDFIVTENHIINSPSVGGGGAAISVGDGSKNVIVAHNTVNGTTVNKSNSGIGVETIDYPMDKVVIIGNTICGINGSGISVSVPNENTYIEDIIIADNIISDCTNGVYVGGIHPKNNFIFKGNIAKDVTKAFICNSGVNDLLLDSCIFDGCTKGLVLKGKVKMFGCVVKNIASEPLFATGTLTINDCDFKDVAGTSYLISMYSNTDVLDIYNSRISGQANNGVINARKIVGTKIDCSGVCSIRGGNTIYVSGCETNGRIDINKDYAIIRDCKIESTNNLAYSAIRITDAKGVSVNGCTIVTSYHGSIEEFGTSDYSLISNNVTTKDMRIIGANSLSVNNVKVVS